jgi:hypothetical protein
MDKQDIIRMAKEAGINEATSEFYCDELGRMLAAAVEQERKEFAVHAIDIARKAIEEEREACAKVAGWLWQQFRDTKEAHERNSPEPFRPERFGFDQSTVQQSHRLMDAIRERSANAGVRGSAT